MNNYLLFCNRAANMPVTSISPVECEKVVDDERKHLLDLIFSTDNVTCLPSGDLQMYYNKNVSPEVKQFIENTLFVSDNTDKSKLSLSGDQQAKYLAGIDDDLRARLTRERNETNEEYAGRIKQFLFDLKKQQYFEKKEKELKEKRRKYESES